MNIYSWNAHSEGATALAAELGIKRIRHENSRYKGSQKKIVINWGSSKLPDEVMKSTVLNAPDKVAICANKLKFFEAISEHVTVPDWTTDHDMAMKWVAEGHTVCARTVLNGHSAEGLVIMHRDDPESFVKAPLYTEYVPKLDEYRVHIVKGNVVDVQRKALRNNWHEENPGQKPNFKVRNLANGFIFARQGVEAPAQVTEQSLLAVRTVGLDFGAVDIIYNRAREKAYVLEINTAPGLEGITVQSYANAIKQIEI